MRVTHDGSPISGGQSPDMNPNVLLDAIRLGGLRFREFVASLHGGFQAKREIVDGTVAADGVLRPAVRVSGSMPG